MLSRALSTKVFANSVNAQMCRHFATKPKPPKKEVAKEKEEKAIEDKKEEKKTIKASKSTINKPEEDHVVESVNKSTTSKTKTAPKPVEIPKPPKSEPSKKSDITSKPIEKTKKPEEKKTKQVEEEAVSSAITNVMSKLKDKVVSTNKMSKKPQEQPKQTQTKPKAKPKITTSKMPKKKLEDVAEAEAINITTTTTTTKPSSKKATIEQEAELLEEEEEEEEELDSSLLSEDELKLFENIEDAQVLKKRTNKKVPVHKRLAIERVHEELEQQQEEEERPIDEYKPPDHIAILPANKDTLDAIVNNLRENEGQDIAVINVADKTTWMEYIIVCTGKSTRHMRGITENVVKMLKNKSKSKKTFYVEGKNSQEWQMLDCGSFIVSVFSADARKYYDMERLWTYETWEAMDPDLTLTPSESLKAIELEEDMLD